MKVDQHQRPAAPASPRAADDSEKRTLLAPEGAFSPRDLFRLGAWGMGAVGALIFAFWLSGQPVGAERNFDAKASQAVATVPAIDELRRENRRLAAALDVLNNDRDRLYARLTIVEKETSDTKASLGNIADTLTTPAPTADLTLATAQHFTQIVMGASPHGFVFGLPAPAGASAKVTDVALKTVDAAAGAGEPSITGSVPMASNATGDAPAAPVNEAAKLPTSPAPAAPDSQASTASAQPAPGIALGRASSVLKLQKNWNALSRKYKSLLEGKSARIAIAGSGADGAVELNLIAGPFTDEASAAKACAALVKDKRACAPAPFAGQDLAVIGAAPSAPDAREPQQQAESAPPSSRKSRNRTADAEPRATPSPNASPSPFRVFFNNR